MSTPEQLGGPGGEDAEAVTRPAAPPEEGTLTSAPRTEHRPTARRRALRFVLLIGLLSVFADFTYEGSRSVTGPYLLSFGAGAVVVAVVSGLGELLGYGLRLVSGRLADATRHFWPITIGGYAVQMASVPLLALAGSWPVAALLIIVERIGKATRNPPRDAMLSHAAAEIGYGTAFGIHEALDQLGAMLGPLAVAGVLAYGADGYRLAFAVLAIPAVLCLSLVGAARFIYPRPQELAATPADVQGSGLPRTFWLYLAGAGLAAAGFADWSLIAFHYAQTSTVGTSLIPVFYAIAMAVSGAGSLLFGRLYDRFGISVLLPLTVVSAAYAPLAFLGGLWVALAGASLWGLGMGVQESIIPAAVATMVPPARRASAYGLFTAGYGIAWFIGSVVIGVLYTVAIPAAIAFALVAEAVALPLFVAVRRRSPRPGAATPAASRDRR
jgi:MFS family permease